DAANGSQGDGAAEGKPFRNHSQHGGPEKGLADPIHGCGQENGQAGGRMTEPEQPDHGQNRAAKQKAERRYFVDDGAGEEPQDKHDAGGVNQDQDAFHVGDIGHEIADPTVGSQLDVSNQGVQ